jgi:hypothetical protein
MSLDFFLWGYVKIIVCETPVTSHYKIGVFMILTKYYAWGRWEMI